MIGIIPVTAPRFTTACRPSHPVIPPARSRPNDAIEQFQKAVELAPKEALYYSNLGHALLVNREVDKAIVVWQGLLKLEPGDFEAKRRLRNLSVEDTLARGNYDDV